MHSSNRGQGEEPLSPVDAIVFTIIVVVTCAWGVLHWACPEVLESAKDGLDPLTSDKFFIPRYLQQRLLFTGLGFVLSFSAVILIREFLAAKGITAKLLFPLRNLILIVVFLATLQISVTVLTNAFGE